MLAFQSDAINARLAKHRGSVHNLQLDIMDGIVQVGKIWDDAQPH